MSHGLIAQNTGRGGETVSSLWVQSCNLQGHSCGETDYATRPQLLSRRINSTSRRQSHCVAFPLNISLRSNNPSVFMNYHLVSFFLWETFASLCVSLRSRRRYDPFIYEGLNLSFHIFFEDKSEGKELCEVSRLTGEGGSDTFGDFFIASRCSSAFSPSLSPPPSSFLFLLLLLVFSCLAACM